ncbi:dolichyl-phosphate-mannose--protein mannosyltransferase [Protaetiibacter intestinalis]|uniref:Polyprenol-phosphate-mannose--protein mannosyltransferase n=1 Tax=Protaetiibacter intestinalis TaxID=2419774 RepID=A0A387B841_9MICO|nr:phospholipid carrier-dependent glycosyltransferase [Protaetiibacter intestinalis]AYF97266.1 phospholipid carrier-dependent glycosyltransferase [Protaetiibacter intestinalis]
MDARAEEFERAVRGGGPVALPTAGGGRGAPAPLGSRLDERWQRWMADPRIRRAWDRGAPAAVLAVAAALRLVALDHPHELVFDETYYVKDAYTLSHLGYEARWPDGANDSFTSGNADVYTSDPSFVVHPPLGKWIIAAGMALFGTDSAFGWRFGIALVGVLLVGLVMLVGKTLFRSTTLAVLAGGLIAIDGNAIVMSRVSLLDGAVAFFALLGTWFVLLDRRWAERRIGPWVAARAAAGRPSGWGPVWWWRPWLLAAAVAFGCATSVKWNGLYFLAVFGLYTVVSDAFLRKRAGIEFWGTGTLLRQAPVNALLLVPLALAVYVTSWLGWFTSDDGYYRHWLEDSGGEAWTGAFAWVPHTLQNWWHYQTSIMNYHVGLTTPHTYQANPLTWLFLTRPTSMHYQSFDDGTAQAILDIANPLIWWGATAAVVFLVVRVVRGLLARRPVATDAFILTGMAAGYLPWLLYLNRTVFQFYTIAFEPFMILALTAALAAIAGRATDAEPRRTAGLATVGVYLGLVVIVSAYFLPMWTAMRLPIAFIFSHYWLHSWI